MNASLSSVLSGAVAMAAFVAMLFFLKYWQRTRDHFFLFFALAFGIDAVSRFLLAVASISDETEPLYYLPRLVSFGLIIGAIVIKNRPGSENS
jgi:uncharacterized membrane protein HdeD (DUF308 family)